MNQKINPFLIGLFVLGALLITIAGAMFLGEKDIFSRKPKFVLFFDGAVTGLFPGAPVNFRGVQVGTVVDVSILMSKAVKDEKRTAIPVIIEIDPSHLKPGDNVFGVVGVVNELVKKGLRAELEMQSFVTGRLQIELNFSPNSPLKYAYNPLPYPQIPTKASSYERITDTIQKIPFEDISKKVAQVMDIVNKIVTDPSLSQGIKQFAETFKEIKSLASFLNKKMPTFINDFDRTLNNMSETFDLKKGKSAKIANDLDRSLRNLSDMSREVEKLAAQLRKDLGQNSEIAVNLNNALTEFSRAARSVKDTADNLDEEPEAIIFGKRKAK